MFEEGKISILMGIYNCAQTLPLAIDSIIAQTYTNWELILCDDCSTDDTFKIAEAYAQKEPNRIILIRNEKNSRLAFTLNRCLSCAKGQFIARMDGDDISVPERLEKQLNFLKKHPDIVLVGTAMQRFKDDGSLGAIDYREEYPDRFTPYRTTVFNHATILAYKSVFDKLGGYTVCPRTVRGQDLDLWFRFLYAGFKGANMTEPLYMVREDLQAIQRRKLYERWIDIQTRFYGYRLLKYPWYWYYKLFIPLIKAFIPSKMQLWYRDYQAKHGN